MDFLKKHILLFIALLGLTSCYTDFEPDIDSRPVLCLNSLITEGDTIRVSLTRTWRWSEGLTTSSDENKNIDIFVYDADVRLYVNDEYKETLRMRITPNDGFYGPDNYPWNATGHKDRKEYICDYIPKAGDKIRLEASSPDYGDAWGETVVPEPVVIDNVDYTATPSDLHNSYFQYNYVGDENNILYGFNLNLLVWFTDPSSIANYYMFKTFSGPYISGVGEDGVQYSESVTYYNDTDEPLFTEHVSALDQALGATSGYSVFSDRQISGKSYPLHIRLRNVAYSAMNISSNPDLGKACIEFTLYSISQSYYKHVISLWVANDSIAGSLGDIGLGDPVFASSNVSTGAGVVAAASKYTFRLYVKPIADELQSAGQEVV